jgi:3-hydroxyacyl-CoA dehydrogenase
MNNPVTSTRHNKVIVLAMNHPPINGLSLALRQGLLAGLDEALADDSVQAIVITGTDKAFSGGADIKEFGTKRPKQEPNLGTLIRMMEASKKPVVAAISGVCLGGGFELAMGCHFRVALTSAKLGLPEVKLGLLPGAGGTQRLPRLVGLQRALNMIVKGTHESAASFKGTRLLDEVVEFDVVSRAVAFAERVVTEGRVLVRVRDLKVVEPLHEPFLQFARANVAAMSPNFPAPLECVEAVAAAVTKPMDEGLRLEREAFVRLMVSPASEAMRHAFKAERAAMKIPDVPDDTPQRAVNSVGVIGAGTMGGGIAMCFANAGILVTILETTQEALDKGVGIVRRNYENTMKKGKLTSEQVEQRMALVKPSLSYDDLRNVDLVIEAVFETMEVKKVVFEKLDAVIKPGAILASNTSALDLDAIAAFTKRPNEVIGLHFFSPANVMRLLEVVRGAKTDKDVLATCMALARKIKKVPVLSGVCDGFIGNRIVAKYGMAANDLVNAGASPQQVDKALERFGLAMGPFRMGDLAGLDIGWATRKRRAAENSEKDFSVVADLICAEGRFGQKTGAGWYRYEAGKRDPIPDPLVDKLIAEFREKKGITPRKVTDEEIVERCIYAMANEGARIVEEGIALRASDIDTVYLKGYGFPLHRGGPMRYADQIGLWNVERALERIAKEPGVDAAFWQPAPLLSRLAAEGKSFN